MINDFKNNYSIKIFDCRGSNTKAIITIRKYCRCNLQQAKEKISKIPAVVYSSSNLGEIEKFAQDLTDGGIVYTVYKDDKAIDLCLRVHDKKEITEIKEQQRILLEHKEAVENIGKDINKLSGGEFENLCKYIFENMGFDVEQTKLSNDGGIDLILTNYQPIFSGKYIIQCKRYSGSVGEPIIRDLYGVVTSERANKGILITTGYFTNRAVAFAEGKQIELIDGVRFNELLKQYGFKDM